MERGVNQIATKVKHPFSSLRLYEYFMWRRWRCQQQAVYGLYKIGACDLNHEQICARSTSSFSHKLLCRPLRGACKLIEIIYISIWYSIRTYVSRHTLESIHARTLLFLAKNKIKFRWNLAIKIGLFKSDHKNKLSKTLLFAIFNNHSIQIEIVTDWPTDP